VAAKAHKGSISIFLTGLGSITPIYTVTLKSRVDGQLMKVLYKEGDLVHQGDLLAEIDARPYEVQLDKPKRSSKRHRARLWHPPAERDSRTAGCHAESAGTAR
jgi:multidrug efflux system membrane fusion protein